MLMPNSQLLARYIKIIQNMFSNRLAWAGRVVHAFAVLFPLSLTILPSELRQRFRAEPLPGPRAVGPAEDGAAAPVQPLGQPAVD